MASINVIAAITNNNAIGKNNRLLYCIKADLRNFRITTTDNIVIMGRKTYESIGHQLPNRINVVVTKNGISDDVRQFKSVTQALLYCKACYPMKDIFIIGGGMLYQHAMSHEYVNRLIITHIDDTVEDADTFFPEIDMGSWSKKLTIDKGEDNGIKYEIVEYVRKRYKE